MNAQGQQQAQPNRLEGWAERTPDKTALIEAGEKEHRQLTFAQWNQHADRVAHALIAAGVNDTDIVATRMRNRIEWAVINAALAKIGAGNLGVNWRLTASELQFMLRDSGAAVLFCDDADPSALLPEIEQLDLKLIVAVGEQAAAKTNGNQQPIYPYAALLDSPGLPPFYSQSDARLVIYTSGTTGFPKGVVVNRASNQNQTELMEYLASVRGEPGCADEVVLVTMPMHHSAGPAIIRTGTSRGSTLIMLPRFHPETVLQLIQQYRVTTWNGVPTMYKRLAALPQSTLNRYDVSSVKALSVGAAPVPYSLKEWIIDYFGPVLKEGYGSTEVGMVTSLPPELQKVKIGSSGRPFKHVKIRIRDAQGRELPNGKVGEIWAYTPVAIHNYLNQNKLNTDTVDAQGYFRMGDMGRLDDDGFLYITDRAKDMIISGGVNIYPAEIEHALIQHPDIQDVAVIGIPDDEFGEQVKAFVELKPGAALSEKQLIDFANHKLASYKRPKSIEFVNELPRSTMGKLLKRELREPYWRDRAISI